MWAAQVNRGWYPAMPLAVLPYCPYPHISVDDRCHHGWRPSVACLPQSALANTVYTVKNLYEFILLAGKKLIVLCFLHFNFCCSFCSTITHSCNPALRCCKCCWLLYDKLLVKFLISKPLWIKSLLFLQINCKTVYCAGALVPCMHCGMNKWCCWIFCCLLVYQSSLQGCQVCVTKQA